MGHNLHSRRILAATTLVTLMVAGSAAAAPGTPDPVPTAGPDAGEAAYVLTGGAAPLGPGPAPAPAAPASPEGGPFGSLPSGAFSSFSTGTVFYTDAILSGKERRTDIELAHAGAAFSSAPVPERRNELGRLVAPALAAGDGFGRGSALDLAFNQEGFKDALPDFDDEAEAKAPPTGAPVKKNAEKLDLNPLVDVQALQAEAAARSVSPGCVLGSDLAFGLGSATNVKLLKQAGKDDALLAARAPTPPRGVSQSTARTRLVPNAAPGTFGLMAEVRETVAPITVLEGDQQLTIEVAGEWVLRAVADGAGGKLVFGPDVEPDDERPLLRVVDAKGRVLNQVTLEQYLGSEGLDLEVEGLIHINLGEDPRAVAGGADTHPVAGATLTAAAADILRVRALDQIEDNFKELRIGHMEAAVAVPAGGLRCPGIGVKKSLDHRSVRPGETFTTAITVSNPNDCILEDVKLTDVVTAGPGVKWTATGLRDGAFVKDGIGPLGPGESEVVRLDIDVDPTSLPGAFSDVATAEGVCGRPADVGETTGGTATRVPVRGSVELKGPEVSAVPPPDAQLPLESASPPPTRAPGGATPANPVGPGKKLAAAAGPARRSSATQVSGQQGSRPAAAPAAGGPATLARSGGILNAGLAFFLIAGGVGLRRVGRRRRMSPAR
jgi:hypothetical protein